jgi:hypothetical protein
LNDTSYPDQAWPEPGHPDHKKPVAVAQAGPTRMPEGNIELMSKKEILDLKPASRLEQVSEKRSKEAEQARHRAGSCPDSALPRESQTDGIFGNDSVSTEPAAGQSQKQSVRNCAGRLGNVRGRY